MILFISEKIFKNKKIGNEVDDFLSLPNVNVFYKIANNYQFYISVRNNPIIQRHIRGIKTLPINRLLFLVFLTTEINRILERHQNDNFHLQ